METVTSRRSDSGSSGRRTQLGAPSCRDGDSRVRARAPLQTGRSSYIDNDRLAVEVGSDYSFSALDTGMHIGAQFQTAYLIPRHQWKLQPPDAPDGRLHTPSLTRDEVPDDATVFQNGEDVAFAGRSGLQTNSPGFPGYGSRGWVLGGGVYFSVDM